MPYQKGDDRSCYEANDQHPGLAVGWLHESRTQGGGGYAQLMFGTGSGRPVTKKVEYGRARACESVVAGDLVRA